MRVLEIIDTTPQRPRQPAHTNRDFAAEARAKRRERFARMRSIAKIANKLDIPLSHYHKPGAFLAKITHDLDRGKPTTKQDASSFRAMVTAHRPMAIYETEIVTDCYGKPEENFAIAIRFVEGATKDRFRAVMLPLKGSWCRGVMEDIPPGME